MTAPEGDMTASDDPEPIIFRIDRPFVGLLFDCTGNLLGSARITDPRG
jgi:hypothetical protein